MSNRRRKVGGVKCHFWILLHDDCTVLKRKSRLFRFGYARAYRRRYAERNRSRRLDQPLTNYIKSWDFCLEENSCLTAKQVVNSTHVSVCVPVAGSNLCWAYAFHIFLH
ncbi:hypothetical protein GHT06_022247 [Daphnia sinensis]|uniref:Uncharacterized protein n=1 Tax=Daphnia sinensis TaxID=1820382 RepID=A0AAD5PQW2_9CRUS|nr:hypothetical protein GHT06_022247 [Daphnia sinensis]